MNEQPDCAACKEPLTPLTCHIQSIDGVMFCSTACFRAARPGEPLAYYEITKEERMATTVIATTTCDVCAKTIEQASIIQANLRVSYTKMGDFTKVGDACSLSCARRMLIAFTNTVPMEGTVCPTCNMPLDRRGPRDCDTCR